MLKGFWVIPSQLGRWISRELHLRPWTLENISLRSHFDSDPMRTVILISHVGVGSVLKLEESVVESNVAGESRSRSTRWNRSALRYLEMTGLKGPAFEPTKLDQVHQSFLSA